MLRHQHPRPVANHRNTLNHKKKQFASAAIQSNDYPHRLNLYDIPPTADITLEQFEQWAIERLRGKSVSSINLALPSSSTVQIDLLPRADSTRGTGGMLLPQQVRRGNDNPHDAPAAEMATAALHIFILHRRR